MTKRAERRYYAFGDYLHERYGCRATKLTVDAEFTCPNLDGTFCNNVGFSPATRPAPGARTNRCGHWFPDVVGLAVGTCPDCIEPDKLALIESYSDHGEVWIE